MSHSKLLQLVNLNKNAVILRTTRHYLSDNAKLPIKLTLYTKSECTLCDKAKDDLNEYYNGLFEVEDIDITKSRDLFRKYKLDIPVFHYNGEFLMKHKIDRVALNNLLEKLNIKKE